MVLGWWLASCDRPAPRTVLRPREVEARPTELAEGQEEEEREHEQRRERFEARHLTPPDVDWRAVERANAEAAIQRATERRRTALPAAVTFVERGSDNQAGSSWQVVKTADHLYSGSDRGGLWRRDRDDPDSWTPIGDELYGGVHHLAVLPAVGAEPEVLFTSPEQGPFFHRSDDGGATWTVPGGLGGVWNVRGVAASTDGSARLWVLGMEGYEGRLYASQDRGRTFTLALSLGTWGDLWVDRVGGSGVIVAGIDGVARSLDGQTFEAGPVPTGLSEVRLAASEATDPPTVYLAARDGGAWDLWRDQPEVDPAARWLRVGGLEDFWHAFAASTRDPGLLAWGGVDLHVSRDGGVTAASPNTWDEYYADPESNLHADIMALDVTPEADGGETWYAGTHGGPYRSADGWRTAHNLALRGMRIGQYYGSHTSWTDPTRVLVGAQDQGLQSGTLRSGMPAERAVFTQEVSGDYGHLVSLTEGSHDRVAMVYPGFVLVRLELDGQPFHLYYDFPPAETPWWLPVLVSEPRGRDAFYFLGKGLWRYEAEDDDPYYAVERWTDTDFGLSPYEQLSGLGFDPFEPKYAWLVTTAGRMFRSEDGARTFRRAAVDLPFGSYYYGSALVVSRLRPGGTPVLYVGGSGYGGDPVWRSLDGGKTFEPWSDGLPATLVNTLVELRDGTGRMVAGTETGVWVRDAEGAGPWVDVSSGAAPVTSWYSAAVLPDQNTVRFSTYGRGLWDVRFDEPGEGCFAARDDDEDGAYCDVDCDDGDPDRFPWPADEVCDGIDHDCVDSEGDPDGDGHPACSDCDSTDPGVNPGAAELRCDGVDQDCDGADACPDHTLAGGGCRCDGARGGPGAPGLLAFLLIARRRRDSGPTGWRSGGAVRKGT